MSVAVIDYGAGNIKSMVNALEKLGVQTRVCEKPGEIRGCSHIVLPGVGAFGDAMERLEVFRTGFKDSVAEGVPFLGVCLGVQVILNESEESPGTQGLGLLRGTCRRFPRGLKVPHMGWNTVEFEKDSPLLSGIDSGSFFYFVHSFYPVPEDESAVLCDTEYGSTKFASVLSKGNVHATQFHPEKSGEQGLRLIKNFLKL